MVTTLGLVLEPTGSIIFNEWTGKGRVGGRPAEVVRPRPVPDPFIHFWYLHIFTCHSAFWHFFSAFCAAHSEMQNAISDGCLRQDFHAGRSPLQYRLAAGQPHPARIISRRLLPLDKLFEELLQPHYSRLQPQTRVPLCFGLFIVGCLNLWTTVRPERLAIGCSESKGKDLARQADPFIVSMWLSSWDFDSVPKYCLAIAISFISGLWYAKFMTREILLVSAKFIAATSY